MLGSKDLDRLILFELDDIDICRLSCINKRMKFHVCDEYFYSELLKKRYPECLNFSSSGESNLINVIDEESDPNKKYENAFRTIAQMKKQYGHVYEEGNPFRQHSMLNLYRIANSSKILEVAAREGELDIVKYTLHKAEFYKDKIQRSDRNQLKKIQSNIQPVNIKNPLLKDPDFRESGNFNKALIIACEEGHLKIVQYLVKNGADINIQYGSPIQEAVSNGRLEIVKLLFENGVNLNLCRFSLLYYSFKFGKEDVCKYLLEKGCVFQTGEKLELFYKSEEIRKMMDKLNAY
jgi:ankyrin repeat protein